jgi:hypothetical protein
VLPNDECQLLQELTHSQRAKQEPNGSIIACDPRMWVPRDNERVEITKVFQMARVGRIRALLFAFERHPDRDVLDPVYMRHINVVEKCSRNDSFVLPTELRVKIYEYALVILDAIEFRAETGYCYIGTWTVLVLSKTIGDEQLTDGLAYFISPYSFGNFV